MFSPGIWLVGIDANFRANYSCRSPQRSGDDVDDSYFFGDDDDEEQPEKLVAYEDDESEEGKDKKGKDKESDGTEGLTETTRGENGEPDMQSDSSKKRKRGEQTTGAEDKHDDAITTSIGSDSASSEAVTHAKDEHELQDGGQDESRAEVPSSPGEGEDKEGNKERDSKRLKFAIQAPKLNARISSDS